MRPTYCVIGELLWDLHADAELETARRFSRTLGGAAANVACGLRARGLEVAVAGVVGRDAFGRGLVQALAAEVVDVSAVALRPGQTGVVFVAPQRDGSQRFFSYRPSVRWPSRPVLPAPWRRGSLRGAALHVAALSPDELAAVGGLAARASGRGAVVSVDLNARPRAWRAVARGARLPRLRALLGLATWVKASEDDLRVLGVGPEPAALGMHPGATLLVTRGPRPVTVVSPTGVSRVAVPRRVATWSIGAGDAFSAALLARIGAGVPETLAAWRAAVRAASGEAAAHLQRAALTW